MSLRHGAAPAADARGTGMSITAVVLGAVLLPPLQTRVVPSVGVMQADVERLVRAAEIPSRRWPSQPPPPIPEVAIVARHGTAVVPHLVSLLSDDPDVERDRKRWEVQQQATLALGRIYAESPHCGRTYCDGDSRERIAGVRRGWLQVIASREALQALSVVELIGRFREEAVFWRQLEIGQALAGADDRRAILALEGWLTDDDRHRRGNAAYVLGRLGDSRGFDTLAAMVADRSPREPGQGIPWGKWTVEAQIRADRYYAARLLGELQDRRGVALLIPLLRDADVAPVVPWSLARIADARAIRPLIDQLDRDDPSVRVRAIAALETLAAGAALPRLRALLQDTRRSNVGERTSVADAASHAIAVISRQP